MRFEIDTDNKTVILKSQFTFAEIAKLKKLLGEDYSEYKLISDHPTWGYYPVQTWWTGCETIGTVTDGAISTGTFTLPSDSITSNVIVDTLN